MRDLSVQVSGKSDFRGQHLQARTARAAISGIGDVKVWAFDDHAPRQQGHALMVLGSRGALTMRA